MVTNEHILNANFLHAYFSHFVSKLRSDRQNNSLTRSNQKLSAAPLMRVMFTLLVID